MCKKVKKQKKKFKEDLLIPERKLKKKQNPYSRKNYSPWKEI